jgi:hypothetical protein
MIRDNVLYHSLSETTARKILVRYNAHVFAGTLVDWKVFEAVGKYAGLAGIALIVLLYIFRQILKLGIFKNIGGKGTLLTINNIINKVFWVTIIAVLAWLAVALFGKGAQSSDSSGNVTTLPAQNIQVSDLPSELLSPVQANSPAELTQQLKQRSSLTLSGSTLTIGAPGEGRTVTIACNTLRLANGARIITNGNHLTIVCLNTQFGDNSGISSFSAQTLKASAGNGVGAGKVRIDSVERFSGALRVSLPGQNGSDGATGGQGGPGRTGGRGANSVQGFGDCRSGGQDGKQGGQGEKGATGGAASNGGDGGELILEGKAASNRNLVEFEAPGGRAGAVGQGGPGGPGGPGGEGGSGGGSCGGGHGGPQGPGGPQGDGGPPGVNGQAGKRTPA